MATMDDVTVTPVEGLNEENRPFPHVPFLGGITDPQAFWMLGGVSGVVVLVLAFTATDFAAIHIPLLVTILCYAACLVTGVAGVLLNQDGIEHRRKAHVRYWLRPRTRVGRLAGERFYVVERWTRRVRVPALPAVPALSVGGRRVWAARAATPARTVVLTGPTVRVRRPDARALVADATIETDEAVEDGRICAVRTNTTGNEKLARWRLTADITPIILRARTPKEWEDIYQTFGNLGKSIKEKDKVQFVVENRPQPMATVTRALDDAQPNPLPFVVEMNARRRAWFASVYEENHAVDATHTLVVEGVNKAALTRQMTATLNALEGLGLSGRRHTRAEAVRGLWEAIRVDRYADDDEAATRATAHALTALLTTREGKDALTLHADPSAPNDETTATSTDGGAGAGTSEDGGTPGVWLTRSLYALKWEPTLLPLMLAEMGLLGVRSRVSYTLRGRSRRRAVTFLRRKAGAMALSNAQVIGVTGHDNRLLAGAALGIDEAHMRVRANAAALLDVGLVVTVMARTPEALDDATKVARDAMEAGGVEVAGSAYDQWPLYRESLPLALGPTHPIKTLTTPWFISPFSKETPGDFPLQTVLGHTKVGGQLVGHSWAGDTQAVGFIADQGIGKSNAMAMLAYTAVAENQPITYVDPSESARDFVLAAGGVEFKMLADGQNVNILELAGVSRDNPIPAIIDILEIIYTRGRTANNGTLSSMEEAALHEALEDLFAHREERGGLYARHLAAYLEAQHRAAKKAKDDEASKMYHRLWRGLHPFHGVGEYAFMMDRDTTPGIIDAPAILINTKAVTNTKGVGAYMGLALATTLADWRGKWAEGQGKQNYIFIDEAYEVFRLATDWFAGSGRFIRHDNIALAIATHRVSDFMNDPKIETSLTAIKKWIIMHSSDDLEVFLTKLGVPAHLATKIPTAQRTPGVKAQALYVNLSAEHAPWVNWFDLRTQPEMLDLMGSYRAQKVARARRIAEAGGAAADATFKHIGRDPAIFTARAMPEKGPDTEAPDREAAVAMTPAPRRRSRRQTIPSGLAAEGD